MRERERLLVSSLGLLLLVFWLGFLVHRSPRFPGSLLGGVLGISGALLMLWPLTYSLVKRVPRVKAGVTPRVPMKTILSWHIYTGLLGALAALLHSGHKFNSVLGVTLTVTMFVVVLSGYVGRYLLNLVSRELHEKEALHAQLEAAYRQTAMELAGHPDPLLTRLSGVRGTLRRMAALFLVPEPAVDEGASTLAGRAVRLAESLADVEYSIRAHDVLKRRFARWLALHIAASFVFYLLLALHIWASVYFGLRWLP